MSLDAAQIKRRLANRNRGQGIDARPSHAGAQKMEGSDAMSPLEPAIAPGVNSLLTQTGGSNPLSSPPLQQQVRAANNSANAAMHRSDAQVYKGDSKTQNTSNEHLLLIGGLLLLAVLYMRS